MSKASNKLDRRENALKAQLETARENGDQKAVERISVFYQMYLKKRANKRVHQGIQKEDPRGS